MREAHQFSFDDATGLNQKSGRKEHEYTVIMFFAIFGDTLARVNFFLLLPKKSSLGKSLFSL